MGSGDQSYLLVIAERWDDPHSIERNYMTMNVDASKVYVARELDTQVSVARILDFGHTDAMSGTEIVVCEDDAVDGHSENASEESLAHWALHHHSHSMAIFRPMIWGS